MIAVIESSRIPAMSLNLSSSQRFCLDAMGIDLWQSRAPQIVCSEPTSDPKLFEQVDMLLDYYQQQTKKSLQWLMVHDATESKMVGDELHVPPLSQLFASAKLKRQLWSLLVTAP